MMSIVKWSSPHLDRLLACHQAQGQSNDCGPFSSAIVLHAIEGKEHAGNELARKMDKIRWAIPPVVRRIPGWATFPWGIVDILREHGAHARWHLLSNPDFLRWNLSSGQILLPIFGELKPMWAHVAILVTFDPAQGWGFVDPAMHTPQLKWRPDEEFTRMWRNYGRIVIEVTP
jgi:hypothetical protein